MRRTPCEVMLWQGLPVIRKEIALSMIQQFGINQREAAQKLDITPAAVCQYLSKKRGSTIITDTTVRFEIAVAAQRIHQDGGDITAETCRICRLCLAKKMFTPEDTACPDDP